MWTNYVNLEKDAYLEALKKLNVYKDLLLNHFNDIDNFAKKYKKVSFKKIVNRIKSLNYKIEKDKKAQTLVILTSSDLDKEYLYDSIKAEFQRRICLYIPMCPIDERIFYHIYNCFIEDLGIEIFKKLNPNLSDVKANDAIRALQEYRQDSFKKDLIKRWFLEDKFTEEEERTLGFSKNINDDENSLEMIKCICNSSEEVILLFFEDIELINQKYGALYGKKWGIKAEIVFLNALHMLLSEISNALIIIPSIKTSWNEVLTFSNDDLLAVLESNKLEFFTLDFLKRKIIEVLDFYWRQNGIRPPPNPFFPLNEDLLKEFFEKSHGNLKRFITFCVKSIEEILSGKRPPAEIV